MATRPSQRDRSTLGGGTSGYQTFSFGKFNIVWWYRWLLLDLVIGDRSSWFGGGLWDSRFSRDQLKWLIGSLYLGQEQETTC